MTRRSLGNGRIWRRRQKAGFIYVGDWKGADGKRQRKVLSSDKRVAQRMLAELIRSRDLCMAGLAVEEGFDRPVADIIEEYVADLFACRSVQYTNRVDNILRRVQSRMSLHSVRDLNPQAFLLYRRSRLADKIANRTANMELTVVRAMLNWAIRSGYIGFNPLQGVQQLPAGKAYEVRPRRVLSEDEIVRFLRASAEIDIESNEYATATKTITGGTKSRAFAQRDRLPAVPQNPLWLALLDTGARFGETVKSTWGDFSEAQASLVLRAHTTKSKKERRLPIRNGLISELRALRLVHTKVRGRLPSAGDFIFLTPKGRPWVENRRNALRRLEAILLRAGIPKIDERGEKIDIHALRHTFASRLARNGVGLSQAQKLLGHSDPKLTAAIYTHLDTEDLRAAVECLPPLRVGDG